MNVKTIRWEQIWHVQGIARRLFGKVRWNMVDKGIEAKLCRLWSGAMLLFKYIYIFNWRTFIRGGTQLDLEGLLKLLCGRKVLDGTKI